MLNANIESEIQFDLHSATGDISVLGSTMVAVDQLITTKKATSYILALVREDEEVGTLELSIVKQQVENQRYNQSSQNLINCSFDEPEKKFKQSDCNMAQHSWSVLDDSSGPST